MAYRKYNKHAYSTTIRSGIAPRGPIRQQTYDTRRKFTPRVYPGYTRMAGAYKRSHPFSGESKYADMCLVTTNTATSTTIANPSNGSIGNISATGTILNWANIPNAIGAQGSLLQIAQGTTKNERIANKLRLYAIRMHLQLSLPANAGGNNNYDIVRVIFYRDRQCNGAAATASEILDNAVNGTQNVSSFQAMDYVDRIQIIKDKTYNLNPTYGIWGTSSAYLLKHFKLSYKCNHEIRYSSTTGAITEVQSENFGVMVISLNGDASILAGQARVYFKDH